MTDSEILTLVDRLERCLLAKEDFTIAITSLRQWYIYTLLILRRRWIACAAA